MRYARECVYYRRRPNPFGDSRALIVAARTCALVPLPRTEARKFQTLAPRTDTSDNSTLFYYYYCYYYCCVINMTVVVPASYCPRILYSTRRAKRADIRFFFFLVFFIFARVEFVGIDKRHVM